jgi:uncharacterized membrane protein
MSELNFIEAIVAEATTNDFVIQHINGALILIKRGLSLVGSLIILVGAFYVLIQFIIQACRLHRRALNFDQVRLNLGRVILLGLEFIVASDVIETTTAPDYYSLGILASIVLIRTFLSYSLNKELNQLDR